MPGTRRVTVRSSVSLRAAFRWVRGPVGWRSRLTQAAAALGFLPLLQGEWLGALVAVVSGLVVVGAWVWATGSGRIVGVTVGTGLLAALVAMFAVSQWPRGLIRAPAEDWFAGWLLIGGWCLAALVIDWYVHAANGYVRLGPAEWVPVRHVIAIMTVFVAICLGFCCLGVVSLFDNDSELRSVPRSSEILPLPPTLRLIYTGPCEREGSAGGCGADFVVTAADGAPRTVTVTRLVEHLRRHGWPLQQHTAGYSACRDVGGLLHWSQHCLVLDVDRLLDDVEKRPRTPPEAVLIYISNIG